MDDITELYDDPAFLQSALGSLSDEELELFWDTIIKIKVALDVERQRRALVLMPRGNEIVH